MENDRRLRADAWRTFSAQWIRHGEYARRLCEAALDLSGGEINMCMAGLFDGGIWLPEAICTEIFENPTESFDVVLERTAKRKCVRKD